MSVEQNTAAEVKRTIERLIQAATTFDLDALEQIYHDDLKVFMIDNQGQTLVADKTVINAMFQSKRDNKEPALNTWADIHNIDASQDKAHVLISRKAKFLALEQLYILSIDLIKTGENWQVLREVISPRPHLEQAA
ncbi:hypothetical protein GCM10007094_34620 [Pseudovibrio japonicus]|uniref:SnoaL-like domain-containing protein n=1 Tax=Pseudovibrio japonicus TaxID=366534 RepID=A0ABQ3EN22_9HYPH|nr:nuclear transport factor 2 family protein [Pseudovibrio japonicus]GHB42445.1 hypothetical protein GCM10007094_34620 [Pseudovibrio japonicus]